MSRKRIPELARKNAKIPETRIDSETFRLMQEAIASFNSADTGLEMTQSSFIRQAIKAHATDMINNGVTLEVRPRQK